MKNVNLILLSSDTDCDGTSYGAHRVVVPMSMALCRSVDIVQLHAIQTDQMSGYHECYDVMSSQEFRRVYPGATDADFWVPWGVSTGRDSWQHGFPYTSNHERPSWNPWVYDDSLGTVLDHTNDDAIAHGNW